jgi:UDP-N-acetylglucosamine 2-epimerase
VRIANIVGERPNLMKIALFIAEMRQFSDIKSVLAHTGQHYDEIMSDVFFQELGVPAPDYNLGIRSGSHTWQTAQVILALEPLLVKM